MLDWAARFVHFVNETRFEQEVNTAADVLRFLERKYFIKNSFEEHIHLGVSMPNYREFNPVEANNFFLVTTM
jgi:hypothetical protein